MAMTLAQANTLSNVKLVSGIIETIIEEGGGIIDRLPWDFITGKSYDYTRESTLPTVDFYDVNEEIAESSPTHTSVSVTLKRILGHADLDKFIRAVKSDVNSLDAEYIRSATKAMTRKFLDAFFYGDVATNAKEFDGLHKLVSTASPDMSLYMGSDATTAAALSLATLDQAIDLVKPGKPDAIFMTRAIRRRLSQAIRATSVVGYLTTDIDQFGKRVLAYDGIPIIFTDFLTQTETLASSEFSAKTGGAGSSIFLVKFGSVPEGGLQGIQASQMAELERFELEKKDSIRFRVKFYCAMALGNVYSLARISGISDAAVVA